VPLALACKHFRHELHELTRINLLPKSARRWYTIHLRIKQTFSLLKKTCGLQVRSGLVRLEIFPCAKRQYKRQNCVSFQPKTIKLSKSQRKSLFS